MLNVDGSSESTFGANKDGNDDHTSAALNTAIAIVSLIISHSDEPALYCTTWLFRFKCKQRNLHLVQQTAAFL